MREDLYEQCSDQWTEKMLISVRFGARPRRLRITVYSSGVRPCSETISGVMAMSVMPGLLAAARARGKGAKRRSRRRIADFLARGWQPRRRLLDRKSVV